MSIRINGSGQIEGLGSGTTDPKGMSWNDSESTMDLKLNDDVTVQVGQETLYRVRNASGSTITNGTVVMANGTLGNSGRILITKAIASTATTPHRIMGIATEDLSNNADGFVTHFGKIRGIQTNGANYGETWVDGDVLYASQTVPGALTKVVPNVASGNVVSVAIVINAHVSNGTLFVRPIIEGHDATVARYTPAGTGAVATTVQNKLREGVSVKDFGAVGDGVTDDTAAIQAAIDSGTHVIFPPGAYNCSSSISVSTDRTTLEFVGGATLVYTTATQTLLLVAADDCKLKDAAINAPAIFDGANVAPAYAIINVTGENFIAEGCKVLNVPKIGIWFNNVNNGAVVNCRIDGGTSEGFFTGANTVHFGIYIDPASSNSQGNYVISGNIIKRCTQGAGSGNLGAASFEQAIVVTGNVFELCWNHGWYSSGFANGVTVTGNAFSGCQVPVALSGKNHVVSSNTLIVQTAGTALATDNEITGISLRDPVNCVVIGNTIKGESTSAGAIIALDDLSGYNGSNTANENIVSNNVIKITNTSSGGCAAIRCTSADGLQQNKNIIEGNIISAPIRSGDGLISIGGAAGGSYLSNSIKNNVIIITGARGDGYAIFTNRLEDSQITGNTIRLEYDDSVSRTISAIALQNATGVDVDGNGIFCSSAFGANISFRAIVEIATCTSNFVTNNKIKINTTKASGALFVFSATSAVRLEHMSTGAPEGVIIAGVGSTWRRTDGGANTTLYVKESGSSNTGWVGK